MSALLRARLSRRTAIVWFALLTACLIAKVLWGYWERDLTSGDTAHYFVSAMGWAYAGVVNVVWSPLYTAFYGTWWHLFPDAVTNPGSARLCL